MGGEIGGRTDHPPAGWYPDPSGWHQLRYWHPSTGWSDTDVYDATTDATAHLKQPQPPRKRTPWQVWVAIGVVPVLLAGLAGALAIRTHPLAWLLGYPQPAAPPLPPGSTLIQDINGSDSDDGWIALQGAAFTSGWSDTRVADFYTSQYPTAQGWHEVPATRADNRTFRCRARAINKKGDWESVLLITSPTPGRYLVTHNEMREQPRQLHRKEATMSDCQDPLAWIPTTAHDWVKADE